MKLDFINNDTVALVFLGAVAVAGVVTKQDTVTTAALGAIGGYIGSKSVERLGKEK